MPKYVFLYCLPSLQPLQSAIANVISQRALETPHFACHWSWQHEQTIEAKEACLPEIQCLFSFAMKFRSWNHLWFLHSSCPQGYYAQVSFLLLCLPLGSNVEPVLSLLTKGLWLNLAYEGLDVPCSEGKYRDWGEGKDACICT